jgi:monoamine oxidase
VNELGYGTVTKTAVQFAERQWPPGYATTEGITQRIYEPTVDQHGVGGVLMSYAGGDGGRRLATMPEHERVSVIETEMRVIHGIAAASTAAFSQAWSAEPLFGGAYAAYAPGQVTQVWEVLRRPYGRIFLAGEHTATWTGYLEGAAESGETAAEAILGGS